MLGDLDRQLAESWGQTVIEIVLRRRPKLWKKVLVTSVEEERFVAWAARWAVHWALRVKHTS